MADVVKVNWSGGKDSTCALLKHIERGDKVIAVCYIPMLTDKIPLILKEHYEFILDATNRFRAMGATVHLVTGKTYYEVVTHRSGRGKFKGRAFGFPPFTVGHCHFLRESKSKALNSLALDYDYEDIGIAFDEVKRLSFLSDTRRSILYELEISEDEARRICEEAQFLSPKYSDSTRDGCALCPQAKAKEREKWLRQYPEAMSVVLELQEFVKRERPDQTPLRNHKWFIEDDGTIN